MAKWVRVEFEGAKWHTVPATLAPRLISEMKERGAAWKSEAPTAKAFIDQPGMCYQDRPLVKVRVAGLTFTVVAEAVSNAIATLKALPVRSFGSRGYYKLHQQYWCIVLTHGQREKLIAALEAVRFDAEAAAVEFYSTREPLNVVLAQAAYRSTGAKVKPEQVGVDIHKRFRPIPE